MEYMDLHLHTTASDGKFKPKEVIKWAHTKKLSAVAITDHDTTGGIDEAISEGEKYDIEVVPGIEINTDYKGFEVHILGYYINYKEPWFQKMLHDIRFARYNRAMQIIHKLNDIGLIITMEEVLHEAGKASIGRPHIARVLENHQYVQNTKEAFQKYIGKDGSAYVERYKLTPIEAIEHIIRCMGIPVLAHPGLVGEISIIKELMESGLQGLEVFHTKHDAEMTNLFYEIAKQYKLIITGGSDCHGTLYNGEPLIGSLKINASYLDKLKEIKCKLE